MINEVRNTVMYVLNKDNNGYITPEAFNSYARQAQIEILEQHFYDYNNAMVRMNNRMAGTGYGDTPKHIKECIDKLTVYEEPLTYNVDSFKLPTIANGNTTEWFRLLNVNYNYLTDIERAEPNQIMNLNNSMLMAPSTDFPVYVHEADRINVYPNTITADVLCSYVRFPYDPKWTYTTVNGDPIFNQGASDYQDFELSISDMPKLVTKILKYCGVDIREQQVVQYVMSEEAIKKQLEQ